MGTHLATTPWDVLEGRIPKVHTWAALWLCALVCAASFGENGGDDGARFSDVRAGYELEFRDKTHYRELPQYLRVARTWLRDASTSTPIQLFVSPLVRRRLQRLKEDYRGYCASRGCTVSDVEGKIAPGFRVTYEDGYWFEVNHDALVFEVTGKPINPFKVRADIKERMERDVFAFLAEHGIRPSKRGNVWSSGHVNLDARSVFMVRMKELPDGQRNGKIKLQKEARLLRDFLVDFVNHSEIADGLLDYDPNNAQSFHRTPGPYEDFRRWVEDFDARAAAGDAMEPYEVVKTFIEKVQRKNANLFAIEMDDILDRSSPGQSLSGRLEIRSVRAQQSFEEFRKLAELFIRRVDFLRSRLLRGEPPAALAPPPLPTVRDQALHFHRYATEAAMSWEALRPSLRGPYRLYRFTADGQLVPPSWLEERCARFWFWIAPH